MAYSVKEKAADARYKREYGKSLQWYNEQLEAQGGGCAICNRKPPAGKRLYVDHNHDADKIKIITKRHVIYGSLRLWYAEARDIGIYNFKTQKEAKTAMRRHLRSLSVRALLCFVCNHKVMGILEKFRVCPQDIIQYLKAYDPGNKLLKG